VGTYRSAYDGEIEAIRVDLPPGKVQGCSYPVRPKSSYKTVSSTDIKSTQIQDCQNALQHLKASNKFVSLQWISGHCNIYGNEQADILAKKRCSDNPNNIETNILPYS
jgi:ribonuclease HI